MNDFLDDMAVLLGAFCGGCIFYLFIFLLEKLV